VLISIHLQSPRRLESYASPQKDKAPEGEYRWRGCLLGTEDNASGKSADAGRSGAALLFLEYQKPAICVGNVATLRCEAGTESFCSGDASTIDRGAAPCYAGATITPRAGTPVATWKSS